MSSYQAQDVDIICVPTPEQDRTPAVDVFFPLWGRSTLPSAVLLHPTDVRLGWDLGSFEAGYDHLGPLSCSSNGICDLAGYITLPGWFCVAAVMFGWVVRSKMRSAWMWGPTPFFFFLKSVGRLMHFFFCCSRKGKYMDLAYILSSMESKSIFGVSAHRNNLLAHSCRSSRPSVFKIYIRGTYIQILLCVCPFPVNVDTQACAKHHKYQSI